MKKYLYKTRLIVLSRLGFRLDMIFRQLQHWIYLMIMYYVWRILIENGNTTEFTLDEIMTYYGIIRMMWMFTHPFDYIFATRLIKSGELNMLLIKPVKPIAFIVANQVGESVVFICINAFSIIFFWILFGIKVALPSNLLILLFFPLALVLGRLTMVLFNIMMSAIAFWVADAKHMYLIIMNLNRLFGGSFIPLSILPIALSTIGKYLPFQYMISFPVNLFLGKFNVSEIAVNLSILMFWMGIFSILATIFWKRGLKAYEATGS